MEKPKNLQICILAAIGAYFIGGVVYYTAHFISNSYEASGLVAFAAMAAGFMYISTLANGSRVDIEHPSAMLIELPRIRVLGEVKDALQSKHFGDKKWCFDNLSERKGTASFSCKVFKAGDEKKPPKQHTVILTAKSEQLTNAASLELHYEIEGETLNREDCLKLCQDTTQYLEHEMQLLTAMRAARA